MMALDLWFEASGELVRFARALDYDGYFESRNINPIDYFEEPHKWTVEYRSWVSYERPDPSGSDMDRAVWDEMITDGWQLYVPTPAAAPGEQERADLENDDIAAGVRP